MSKIPKIFKYGIEITKPHSKEMYDHNDKVALEMKRNIVSEIHKAYSNKDEDLLQKIVKCFTGWGFGDGFELEEIKDEGLNTLANVANHMMSDEYGWLVHEGIVPKVNQDMVGFETREEIKELRQLHIRS